MRAKGRRQKHRQKERKKAVKKKHMVQPQWWNPQVEKAWHEKRVALKLWQKEYRKKKSAPNVAVKAEMEEKTRIFKAIAQESKDRVNALKGETTETESKDRENELNEGQSAETEPDSGTDSSESDEEDEEIMDGCVARLRGLPWSTCPEDVVKFFDGCEIAGGMNGVHLTISREGRASGEAFVEFASEDDVKKALEKHNEHMGSRYVEVFRSKKSEMDWVVKRSGADHSNMSEACVKLRGLPFGCSKEEIAQFFSGLEIVPNGIMLPEDRLGRSTGEAFVQFASQDIAEKALGKHKDRIGHRYIEIFKSCLAEANAVTGRDRGYRSMGRPGPYDRGDRFGGPGGGPMGMGFNRGRGGRNVKGFFDDEMDDYNGGGFGYGGRGRGGMGGRYGMMDDRRGDGPPGNQYMSRTGHSVHMRGLPFQAGEQEVFEFFAPIQPVRVHFEFSGNGRPTGEANVDFATHQEAMDAMKKHKCNMQHRYIELFLNSTSRSHSQDGGYGGSDMGSGFGGSNMGGSNFGNNSGNFGNSSMGGGFNNMGSSGSGMGGGGGMGSGSMGSGMGGGGMGGGSGMGGGGGGYYSSGQSAQYSGSQYNSNMGSGSGYNMGSSNQGSGYGNQGMNSGYMGGGGGGGGGGYNSMGSNTMNSLANPGYTAF